MKRVAGEVPAGVDIPTDKLLLRVAAGRIPVVLVACGSFSPPTLLHTRLLEDAKDTMNDTGKYEVIGGYLVPVHDAYGKKTLAPQHHRVAMAGCAVAGSDWLMVDPWETEQEGWTRTAVSLDRIGQQLREIPVQVGDAPPETGITQVRMVCGGDLLESFAAIKEDGEPLWLPEDQERILVHNGVSCMERAGTDLKEVIQKHKILRDNEERITIVKMKVENNISSTVVRQALQQRHSIKYLVEDLTIAYIKEHNLASLPQWQ